MVSRQDFASLLDDVTEHLSQSLRHIFTLKDEQKVSITSLLEGKDVLAVLPTGFGKSLIYQYFLIAKQQRGLKASALVICPLSGLIQDQIVEAESLGLSVCCLNELLEAQGEINELPQLILASAEDVQSSTFRNSVKDSSDALHKNIELMVVDESHTIETWTGIRTKSKRGQCGTVKAFREAFGNLAILQSLCKEGTPILALTGTADKSTVEAIKTSLSIISPVELFVSPNRPNIRISVIKCAKIDMLSQFNWLINLVKDKGVGTPKCLVFCNTMNDIANVSNYLLFKLGDSAFCLPGEKLAENCLIGIYHSATWDTQKTRIINSLKNTESCVSRIIVATTALSMGVNFPDICYVINWGPPRTLLDYHQEIGRAGRDGKQSDAVIIFYGQQLTHCEEDVKFFVKSSECYRVASLQPFDDQIKPLEPLHNCCSVCMHMCKCIECDSQSLESLPFEVSALDSVDSSSCILRMVSDTDREDLKSALTEVFEEIVNKQDKLDVKFYEQLTIDIVSDCQKIFTVEDLITNYAIFSVKRAINILGIFNDIFNDMSTLPLLRDLAMIDSLVEPFWSIGYTGQYSSSDIDNDMLL